MNAVDFVISFLTSAAVSGVAVFLLKSYLNERIRHRFEIELERFKSQMSVQVDEQHEIIRRRLEAYPKLVELVYRTRNMARDLSSSISLSSFSLFDELSSRVKELENCLYHYRIDPERDELFVDVHKYKNLLLSLTMRLSDMKFFFEHKEDERANNAKKDLVPVFVEIETLHKSIIHALSGYSVQYGDNKKNPVVRTVS